MKKSVAVICGIAGLLIFSISIMYAVKSRHVANSLTINISKTKAENLSILSIQEGLDIVFDYAVVGERQILDIELRGKEENGGRLRYVWHESIYPKHDNVISEQGYIITSDNTVYRSFLYAISLNDSDGSFMRTEWVNVFWVNMLTGEVIEQRWYDESTWQWEYTEEYYMYIWEQEPWVIYEAYETDNTVQANALTMQEMLDILYNYLGREKNGVYDLTLLEFDCGPGYEWREEEKPCCVFQLDYSGYTETQNKVYAIFQFLVQMYTQDDIEDAEGNNYYEGEQNLQFYAVDVSTGEIIESREYGEDGTREYTQEYRERVMSSIQ